MRAKAIFILPLLAALSVPALAQDKTPPDGDKKGPADNAGADGDKATDGDRTKQAPEPEGIDVDALRQQYLKLRDRLFRSRARAATVASAVFSTKLSVGLYYTSGRYYTITRAVIRLDGSSVFDDSDGAIAKDKAPRWTGWIAPGRHQVEIRIEAVGKDDERFKSVIQNSFTLQAPAGKDLIVIAKAKDAGNIPYKWKKKETGTYKLRLDIDVDAVKRKGVKAAKAIKATTLKSTSLARKAKPSRSHVASKTQRKRR